MKQPDAAVSPAELLRLLSKQQRGNKFRSQMTEYQGIWYHSRLEAHHAKELDILKYGHQIRDWERQVPLLIEHNNGRKVVKICKAVLDFRVTNLDGSHEYHETKGHETPVWRLKRKLLEAYYPDLKIVVIR